MKAYPMIKVSEKEYKAFLESYPNKLKRDVAGFFDPPIENWNDFTTGLDWPESVVAWCRVGYGMPKDFHILADTA